MSFEDFERKAPSTSPGRVPRAHRRPHRVRVRAHRRLLPRARHLPDRGLRPRPRRGLERRPRRAPTATRASTRSTRPRRLDRARVACWSRAARALVEHARAFRNYGKPDYEVQGLNFRMSEFTAALGLVQIERLPEIVAWKNEVAREQLDPVHPASLELPRRDGLGLYKYIVFDSIERSTGKVYDEPCHRIMGHHVGAAEQRLGGARTTGASRSTTVPTRRRCRVRVLVTGGARASSARTWSTSCARAGHEPRDLRPAPVAVPRGREVDTVLGSITDREALVSGRMHGCDAVAHLAAVGRRQRRPRRARRGRRARQRARHRHRARGRAPGGRRAGRLRVDDLGLLATAAATRSTRTRCCLRPATSTPPPSSRASCTARPTRSSTGSTTRSCASASPTARARARRR